MGGEFIRTDGRKADELRGISIEINFIKWAEGSCLISMGDTRVICTASVLNTVPQFAKEKGIGWIFAEYSMLPRSVDTRTSRGHTGRSQEVQRIIGRALRGVCDLSLLAERTIAVDCDVIQADGSTRCASIIGGFVALFLALYRLWEDGIFITFPIRRMLGAVSCGIVKGQKIIDLTYEEDSEAECDIVVVGTQRGEIIEVQGAVENGALLSRKDFDELVSMGLNAIPRITQKQKEVLAPMIEKLRFPD